MLKTIFYLKKYWALSLIVFLFIVFGSALEVFNVGLLFPILQAVSGSDTIFRGIPVINRMGAFFAGWDRPDVISILLIFYLASFIARSMIFYLGNVAISKQRFLLTRDLQVDLFDRLMSAGIGFFDSAKSGFIINSLYNETTRIGNFINCVLRICAMAVRLSVGLVILTAMSWKFTLIALLVFIVIRIPLSFVVKRIRQIGVAVNKAIAGFNFTVLEAINGIRVIRIFAGEDYERKRFKNASDDVYRFNYSNLKHSELMMPISQIAFLSIFVGLFIVALRVLTIDVMKMMPYVVTYLYVSKNVLTDFGGIQDRRAEAAGYLGAFDSYEDFLKRIDESAMADGIRRFEGLRREIRFENVRFSYEANKKVLDGASFIVPKDKTTAIVGSSGTGKTTIAHLILRFYDVSGGRITMDGFDLKEFELRSWRKNIGVVSQDVFIFNASARDNIVYGRQGVRENEIRAAARIADIDDYIMSLPAGYDTIFGERGVKLSGGQRQRMSIARAIIQNPEILILDEATSHLDTRTEKQIQRALDELSKNRTVIVIAHRLSTIHNADNIIVLDEGRIAESGNHSELIHKQGIYRKLHETQINAQNI
ncbi:MAG: ABC transporter ATP-binding protein [Candidatus Omnitrophica bacterium]|nr:ABC transporter ATP-binding protein [Candidatus Omnitrophota bacterium]